MGGVLAPLPSMPDSARHLASNLREVLFYVHTAETRPHTGG
jgi:hypothetical protein